jgi:hypothetical protein
MNISANRLNPVDLEFLVHNSDEREIFLEELLLMSLDVSYVSLPNGTQVLHDGFFTELTQEVRCTGNVSKLSSPVLPTIHSGLCALTAPSRAHVFLRIKI